MDKNSMNLIVERVLETIAAQSGASPKPTAKKPAEARAEAENPSLVRKPSTGGAVPPPKDAPVFEDITSKQAKAYPTIDNAADFDSVVRMKGKTPARIGVGRSGPRLKTQTLLTLRADHAAARDAVFKDVDEKLLEQLGLFSVKTCCKDKNEFLTRPDLGRAFDNETIEKIKSECKKDIDVQLILSDGLSSTAIEANAAKILPALEEGLKDKGYSVGTNFFVKFGRVACEDAICEALGAKVVCILIGERPGLATAESMSAYIAYKATVGMPESRRTVVSNIHSAGIPAVEAGAYIADVIEMIMNAKASGVELQK